MPLFTTETDGKLRQGVRRQVGNPAAQAAPHGAARCARGERPLLRDSASHRQESALGAAGKGGVLNTNAWHLTR